jgi:AhpD family alkylhydroperoxidase
MSTFTIHTPESAPEESRVALTAFVAMQSGLRRSSLTAAEREIVGITVSRENGSPYSMAAHSAFAERAGLGAAEISALRDGGVLSDARHEALHSFTAELLRSHGHVAADDSSPPATRPSRRSRS